MIDLTPKVLISCDEPGCSECVELSFSSICSGENNTVSPSKLLTSLKSFGWYAMTNKENVENWMVKCKFHK